MLSKQFLITTTINYHLQSHQKAWIFTSTKERSYFPCQGIKKGLLSQSTMQKHCSKPHKKYSSSHLFSKLEQDFVSPQIQMWPVINWMFFHRWGSHSCTLSAWRLQFSFWHIQVVSDHRHVNFQHCWIKFEINVINARSAHYVGHRRSDFVLHWDIVVTFIACCKMQGVNQKGIKKWDDNSFPTDIESPSLLCEL